MINREKYYEAMDNASAKELREFISWYSECVDDSIEDEFELWYYQNDFMEEE